MDRLNKYLTRYETRIGRTKFENAIISTSENNSAYIGTQSGSAIFDGLLPISKIPSGSISSGHMIAQFQLLNKEMDISKIVFAGGNPMQDFETLKATLDILTHKYAYNFKQENIQVIAHDNLPAMKRLLSEYNVKLSLGIHAVSDSKR